MELLKAAHEGNLDEANRLLDRGTDPNEPGYEGMTPLIIAAIGGQGAIAATLLDHGADIDSLDEARRTALTYSIARRNDDVTELLLEAGAGLNLISPHGDSPLLAAVTSRQFDLARRLLKAGAEPRAEDTDYLDVLHWEQRAAAPEYQQSVDEVRDLAGVEPQPVQSLPGAVSFRFTIPEDESQREQTDDRAEAIRKWSNKFNRDHQSLADQVNAVIDELQNRIAARGFHLLDAGMPLGCGPMTRFLVLVPTADHFAVMAAFGTHGNDDQLSNRDLIAWFREFEKERPFILRGCKYDTIDIELERPLDDPKRWAKELVEFNSDIWHDDDLTFFERQLETATRIHFWWD